MRDYHINVFWSQEDNTYIADIPDLKYCAAHGPTPEAALHEVLLARDAWLETAKSHGKAITPPRYRPAIYQASR